MRKSKLANMLVHNRKAGGKIRLFFVYLIIETRELLFEKWQDKT